MYFSGEGVQFLTREYLSTSREEELGMPPPPVKKEKKKRLEAKEKRPALPAEEGKKDEAPPTIITS